MKRLIFDNKYIRTPFVSEYFNDGFQLFALQEEKAVTEYYYILYGGDGEYRIKFNDDPDNSHGKIVTIHIKK